MRVMNKFMNRTRRGTIHPAGAHKQVAVAATLEHRGSLRPSVPNWAKQVSSEPESPRGVNYASHGDRSRPPGPAARVRETPGEAAGRGLRPAQAGTKEDNRAETTVVSPDGGTRVGVCLCRLLACFPQPACLHRYPRAADLIPSGVRWACRSVQARGPGFCPSVMPA